MKSEDREECPVPVKNTPVTQSGENKFPVLNLGGGTHFTVNFNMNSSKE